MNKEIVILDLFSGIGGFPLGLEKSGFSMVKHYFSEINKHAIAVYQHQFKNAEYVGTVENIKGEKIERPNILTFGSPCQDFSIAGKRKGLDGKRSSLIIEAIRIISETRPDLFIWENVKGAFSSNRGRDFQAILQAFTNIGGYRLEWQLLNTAWFLPQNRERIFLIGHLTGKSKPRVFPFTENDQLFNKTKTTEKRRTQTKYRSTALTSKGCMRADDTYVDTLSKADEDNLAEPYADKAVIPVLTPNRKEKRQFGRRFKENGDPSFTLTAQDRHGVFIAGLSMKRTEKGKELRDAYENGEIKHGFNQHRIPTPRKDGLSNTIDTSQKSQRIIIEEPALHTMGISKPNRKCIGAGRVPEVGTKDESIRRLTEIECERLQGFPDNWTAYGLYDNEVKKVSKTQRYIMNGNAATVDVIAAIGNRLLNN